MSHGFGFDEEFVVFDLETTGLSVRRAEVIEVGAVRVRDGRPRATFHALARPSRPLSEDWAIHGITNEMVAGCLSFDETFPSLVEFIGERVLVAHHARFDTAFLGAAARRAGAALRNEVWCTVRLSRRLFPEVRRHDLASLCMTHGIRRAVAHRALPDASATAELLARLLECAVEQERTREEVRDLATLRPTREAPVRAWTDAEREALEVAMLTGDRVALRYVSRRGRAARREVVTDRVHGPNELLLVAYDLEAGCTRTFRLDRVAAIERID